MMLILFLLAESAVYRQETELVPASQMTDADSSGAVTITREWMMTIDRGEKLV